MKKVKYIPSRFGLEEVKQILNNSKDKSTEKWNNPAYAALKIFSIFVKLMVVGLLMFIFYQLFYEHKTYLVSVIDIGRVVFHSDILLATVLAIFLYLFLWIAFGCVAVSLINFMIRKIYKRLCTKGIIVRDRFKDNSSEIVEVYKEIEEFKVFYNKTDDDTPYIYQVGNAERHLLVTIPLPIGEEKRKFFFGSYLKNIIKEGNIIDFSELDTYYGLLEE